MKNLLFSGKARSLRRRRQDDESGILITKPGSVQGALRFQIEGSHVETSETRFPDVDSTPTASTIFEPT